VKIFNIGMVLDWAKGQDVLRGTDSVCINKAMEEYAALQKHFEADNSASDNTARYAICTCLEAQCRYRSATEPDLCLDLTDKCKYKQQP
jgi:hypothetical protein